MCFLRDVCEHPHTQQPLCLTTALPMLLSRSGPFLPHQQPVMVHLTTPTNSAN